MKAIVIINEQHSLLEEQERILNEKYNNLEFFEVPAKGWTLKEMEEKYYELLSIMGAEVKVYGEGRKESINHVTHPSNYQYDLVFVSPVTYLLKKFASSSAGFGVKAFHNDNRNKKELPNGKIVYTIAKTGWQLI